MACRFPGGIASPDAYWEFLCRGGEAISEIGPDRWSTDYFFHPDLKTPGKSYTWAAGVLPDIDAFDARFFGISPREAAQVDPQQRILLELAIDRRVGLRRVRRHLQHGLHQQPPGRPEFG
jgi:acyl transferase domain-containing protein